MNLLNGLLLFQPPEEPFLQIAKELHLGSLTTRLELNAQNPVLSLEICKKGDA